MEPAIAALDFSADREEYRKLALMLHAAINQLGADEWIDGSAQLLLQLQIRVGEAWTSLEDQERRSRAQASAMK
jgi:hypothetical protein